MGNHVSRRSFLQGALAASAVALSACVPAAAPSGGGDEAMAPSDEPITLLFHTRLGTHADWHVSRKDLFEEQNPGLIIEFDELPGNEMYPKIYALSASGTVGDVVWTYLNNPPEHKAKGVLVPLDDIVAAKDFDLSPFWDSLIAALTLNGELHAIPNHGHFGTTAYYINRNLIEESGAEVPSPDWTTDDVVTIGQAITAPPEVWGVRAMGVGQEHIPSYLRIFGGDAINEEGTKSLLDQEESIAGLQWLYDLRFTHGVDPCLCSNETFNNYVAGTVGVYNWTTGFVGRWNNQKESGDIAFDWDVLVGPVGPTGLRGSQVSAAAFGITGNSKHPSEAFQILDFYSTKEDGIEHVLFGAGSPGGRADVWDSDELFAVHPIFRQHIATYPDGPRKWHRPANARTLEFVDTLNNNLQAVWTEVTTFDEGAAMEPVHLRWDTFRGIGSGWNEERIETFTEMHSDVTIELRPLAGSGQQDNYAKMYAAQAAGDLGEVIAFDPSHYHFWRAINKNIIMPIDELVAADGTDLGQWFEHFLGLQYYQGQLYGFPSWGWAGFDTLVTNAVHFEEAGLDVPDPVGRDVSIDTIREWAHSFYVEGERFGLNISHNEATVVVLCRLFGSSLINEEGTQCLLLDDSNATEAMRWAYDLGVVDQVLPAPGDIDNAGGALVAGLLTLNWCGSLCVRNFNNQIEDESVAKASQILFPAREDGRFPSQLRGGTWNLRTDQDHSDISYQFLLHIAGHDGSLSFNLVAGNFAMVRPDVVDSLIGEDPIHEWFISSLENGIPAHAPANSRGREYTSAVQQWTDLLLDPHQPVEFEQGLQDLNDNIQAVLDMEPA